MLTSILCLLYTHVTISRFADDTVILAIGDNANEAVSDKLLSVAGLKSEDRWAQNVAIFKYEKVENIHNRINDVMSCCLSTIRYLVMNVNLKLQW